MTSQTPHTARYHASQLPALTGYTLSDLLWLEYLRAFPSPNCNPGEGLIWPAAEIDAWVLLLQEPDMRRWVNCLLRGPSDDQSH